MKHQHLIEICARLKLGNPSGSPKRIYGGLRHEMWHLTTNKAAYAIKQLSQHVNLADEYVEGFTKDYNLSEGIASQFIKKGVPAVCAIEKSKNYLTNISGTGYLTYPYCHANTLHQDQISEHHALQIPAILANMHTLNLNVPTATGRSFNIHTNDKILALITKIRDFDRPLSDKLQKYLSTILSINKNYRDVIPLIKQQRTVITHGDLNQKNVLWDESGDPIIIDWESVQRLNPTYDMVVVALDWSGIITTLNKNLFSKMIDAYQKAGGIIDTSLLDAYFYGILGGWLHWLFFKIEYACETTGLESRNTVMEEVKAAFRVILNLAVMQPELVNIINLYSASKNSVSFVRSDCRA